MCRACYDNNGNRIKGRRCPNDTSEARKARRYAARIKTNITTSALAEPITKEVLTTPRTPQDIKNDLAQAFIENDTLKAERLTRELGASITNIAKKHGLNDEPSEELSKYDQEGRDQLFQEYEAYEKSKQKLKLSSGISSKEEFENAWNLVKNQPLDKDNRTNEEQEAYEILTKNGTNPLEEAQQAYLQHKENTCNVYGKYLQKRLEITTNSIHKALQESGIIMGDKEDMVVTGGGNKAGIQALQEIAHYYPKQWLDNSAKAQKQGLELWVGVQKKRAHYQSKKEVKETRKEGGELKPNIMWSSSNYDKNAMTLQEWNTKYPEYAYSSYDAYDTYIIPTYVYSYTPKKGKNWEEETYQANEYNNGKFTKVEKTRWKRLKKNKQGVTTSIKTKRQDQLILNQGSDNLPETNNFVDRRVALHEFAHRVEDTSPRVKALENAFIQRRVTLPDGSYEKPFELYPGENVYRDHFPDYYIGKTYPDRSTEVLSMGMETIFAGTQGDYFSDKNPAVDTDYRNFIIGILASSK